MELEQIQIGDKLVSPYTIPSGIVMTSPACATRLLEVIPELGFWTTKSIGLEPRVGYREPILHQVEDGTWINAVGLTNPGCFEFGEELARTKIPKDKAVLCSIFGKDAREFVKVAKTLEDYVDAFELNLSCPHATGYGMQLGQDPEAVNIITYDVVHAVKRPVYVKLTPKAINIDQIAKIAIQAGAKGIVAINTEPGLSHMVNGTYVLSNRFGGLSGAAIRQIGTRCVRQVREAIGSIPLIIAMGGIDSSDAISEYVYAGANAIGIGSFFAGMNEQEIQNAFSIGRKDLEQGTNYLSCFKKRVSTKYFQTRIEQVVNQGCDFKIAITNSRLNRAGPGQFVFAYIPGVGEKPFSIMDNNPLTLGIQTRGEFTRAFNTLKEGESFYVRGPYGQSLNVPEGSRIHLVGGGCGIAGLLFLAKKFSKNSVVMNILGAKDKMHLPYLEEFEKYGNTFAATDDGSLGAKGTIADLLNAINKCGSNFMNGDYFFNCGPRAMVDAVLPLELQVSSADRIYSSLDYLTKCGVGLCGSCVDNKGKRTCVEGPFMKL